MYSSTLCVTLSILFFSSRRRHTRLVSDWSSDVCSTNLECRLLLELEKCHDSTPVTDQSSIPRSPLEKTARSLTVRHGHQRLACVRSVIGCNIRSTSKSR